MANKNVYKRWRRHKRVRNRVIGTPERPRVCVFRSNTHIYAQLIDDTAGRTLVSVSSLKLDAPTARPAARPAAAKAEGKAEGKKGKKADKAEAAEATEAAATSAGRKTVLAREVGRLLAEAAKAKGVSKVAFDRGGYLYHGRVAALAEAARKAGLDF
jgi:large subunit ribosomal protein L18